MTFNQIPTHNLGKKRIAIGAATVLTAGALLGVGVAGASASTSAPDASGTGSASASASSSHKGDSFSALSVVKQVREAFFSDTLDASKAHKLATAATEQTLVFSKLPSALQTDLTSLGDASATARDAAAKKISATSLNGGYGDELKTIATDLKSGEKLPLGEIIRDAVADLSLGKTLGQADLPQVPTAPVAPAASAVPAVPIAPTAPSSHVGADAHTGNTSGLDILLGK